MPNLLGTWVLVYRQRPKSEKTTDQQVRKLSSRKKSNVKYYLDFAERLWYKFTLAEILVLRQHRKSRSQIIYTVTILAKSFKTFWVQVQTCQNFSEKIQ